MYSYLKLAKLIFIIIIIAHIQGTLWHWIGDMEINSGYEENWIYELRLLDRSIG